MIDSPALHLQKISGTQKNNTVTWTRFVRSVPTAKKKCPNPTASFRASDANSGWSWPSGTWRMRLGCLAKKKRPAKGGSTFPVMLLMVQKSGEKTS